MTILEKQKMCMVESSGCLKARQHTIESYYKSKEKLVQLIFEFAITCGVWNNGQETEKRLPKMVRSIGIIINWLHRIKTNVTTISEWLGRVHQVLITFIGR